jgi:superfamily II DNA/RNA helicase
VPAHSTHDEVNSVKTNITLHPILLRNLSRNGIHDLTAFQKESFKTICSGRDTIAIAPTGTGKTAAALLPLISMQLEETPDMSAILVLVPTRELCRQSGRTAHALLQDLPLSAVLIHGGQNDDAQGDTSSTTEQDIQAADIVVATPGRLSDYLHRKNSPLPAFSHVVLDEADRLLDAEFLNDTLQILDMLPYPRQTILTTATLPETLAPVLHEILIKPVTINATDINDAASAKPRVRQGVMFVTASEKQNLLLTLLQQRPDQSCIVFSATREETNALFHFLKSRRMPVASLHGGMDQAIRDKTTESFRSGKASILVTTDLMARGLDIPQVQQVISLSPPTTPETHIHRIGRTGRAGRYGWSITFCDPSERAALRKIEATIKEHLKVLETPQNIVAAPPSVRPKAVIRPKISRPTKSKKR